MKVIDISWPITVDMTTYKNRGDIKIEQTKTFEKDAVRESQCTMGMHVGTHVDAPAHFLARGDSIEQVALERLMGECKVLDLSHVKEVITVDDVAAYDIEDEDIILFKTKNSAKNPTDQFDPSFVYLDAAAAQYLVDANVKAVGIDYLGIERGSAAHDTHKALLIADVAIIEGLRLAHVEEGAYSLVCLPLFISGTEAAPARAVLFADDEEDEE